MLPAKLINRLRIFFNKKRTSFLKADNALVTLMDDGNHLPSGDPIILILSRVPLIFSIKLSPATTERRSAPSAHAMKAMPTIVLWRWIDSVSSWNQRGSTACKVR